MKSFLKLLCVFLFTSVVCISCAKTDCGDCNPQTQSNHLKIGEIEYSLSKGNLEYYDVYNEHYALNLYLHSEDYSESTPGELLRFYMHSSQISVLDVGKYTYSDSAPYTVGIYESGYYCSDCNAKGDEFGESDLIYEGTVNVEKNEEEYIITINCTSGKGQTVTGFFRGPLEYDGN